MSQLFLATAAGYEVHPLRSDAYHLITGGAVGLPSLVAVERGMVAPRWSVLMRVQNPQDAAVDCWLLLVGRGKRVLRNGALIDHEIALLDHRDELRIVGSAPIYFSSERVAAIERCTRVDEPRCPRCAQPIARGQLAVVCPGCGVLHHQLADRSCWTYLPRCAACEQPSQLEAELRWNPEDWR